MKLSDFTFDLPNDRIARFPAESREESRLMVVDRESGSISHHRFGEIADILSEEDFLVVNNTRVVSAKLFGRIGEGSVEVLVISELEDNCAEVFALPGKKFKPGVKVVFDKGVEAEVIEIGERGKRILKFNCDSSEYYNAGYAPLPPYIKRKGDEAREFRDYDLSRYQTTYAKEGTSIAAPTAGLHFSEELFDKIRSFTDIVEVNLNVGFATFQSIEVENLEDHKMGKEYINIPEASSEKIGKLRKTKKLVATGTTSVRSLETYALLNKKRENFSSELFIYPGFEFKMVDRLITNFHLPGSSLFVLTSAFGGVELMREAYEIAIADGYRFFSYGDAMFIR